MRSLRYSSWICANSAVYSSSSLVQGGAGVDVAVEDGGLDLADEGRVAQQQAVGAEDGRLFLADFLA